MANELVLERESARELFMAALLLSTSHYKGAKVRLLEKDEDFDVVNVNPKTVEKYCPSWTSSALMSQMIQFKVCAPVIDNITLSVEDKVTSIKGMLESQAKVAGIEMPS